MSTANRLLLRLTRNLRVREILRGEERYIERHAVCCIGPLTAYLHRYLSSDGDAEVHDHPWSWSMGIPLTGGYDEERVTTLCPRQGWISRMRRVRPWRWNWIGAMTFHRIAHVQPGTWTLFIHGRRIGHWGFLQRTPRCASAVRYVAAPDYVGWLENGPLAHELRARLGE